MSDKKLGFYRKLSRRQTAWIGRILGSLSFLSLGSGGRRLGTYKLTVDGQGNGAVSPVDHDMYFAGKLLRSHNKPVVLDRLGSVHAWIDADKNAARTKYYPFGEERHVTRHNRRKFGTYVRDEFSKLDYAEQRYYSSALGRFITPDPYEGSVRLINPDSWNRYAYVENDPINRSDPHGTDWTVCQYAYLNDCVYTTCPLFPPPPNVMASGWCFWTEATGQRKPQWWMLPTAYWLDEGQSAQFPLSSALLVIWAYNDAFNRLTQENSPCSTVLSGPNGNALNVFQNTIFAARVLDPETYAASDAAHKLIFLPPDIDIQYLNQTSEIWPAWPSDQGSYIINSDYDNLVLSILHELAHITGAAYEDGDEMDPENQTYNDTLVALNCGFFQ